MRFLTEESQLSSHGARHCESDRLLPHFINRLPLTGCAHFSGHDHRVSILHLTRNPLEWSEQQRERAAKEG